MSKKLLTPCLYIQKKIDLAGNKSFNSRPSNRVLKKKSEE
jgi:hypothetical protein